LLTNYKPEGRGLIPDEVIGFFSFPYPSSLYALGSTQRLREMSIRTLPRVKSGLPARKSEKLTAIREPIV
jgi:hypothetical protein